MTNKFDKFEVEKILYNESRQISALSIKKQGGGRVFVWQRK